MEASWVFELLDSYIKDANPPPPPRLEDFSADSTPDQLFTGAQRAYNACMHACLFSKTSSELAALTQCDAILRRVLYLSLTAVASAKRSARQAALPSQLLRMCQEVSPLQALRLAQTLRAKVRECLDRVGRSALLAELDNDAKRQIAGFAGRCGAHALKALRYRGVDFERTRAGLRDSLEAYAGSPLDAALEDEINGYTLEEVLLDARAVLPDLMQSVHSVIDLLRRLPLVGRTLTLRPVCDGADMNPWLQVRPAARPSGRRPPTRPCPPSRPRPRAAARRRPPRAPPRSACTARGCAQCTQSRPACTPRRPSWTAFCAAAGGGIGLLYSAGRRRRWWACRRPSSS